MLDEHFRSLPPIIDFSNQEFYGGKIRIMRKDKVGDKVLLPEYGGTKVVPDNQDYFLFIVVIFLGNMLTEISHY